MDIPRLITPSYLKPIKEFRPREVKEIVESSIYHNNLDTFETLMKKIHSNHYKIIEDSISDRNDQYEQMVPFAMIYSPYSMYPDEVLYTFLMSAIIKGDNQTFVQLFRDLATSQYNYEFLFQAIESHNIFIVNFLKHYASFEWIHPPKISFVNSIPNIFSDFDDEYKAYYEPFRLTCSQIQNIPINIGSRRKRRRVHLPNEIINKVREFL